jgi:HprK-related kinase A
VKVAALSPAELSSELRSRGVFLRTGPFIYHIQSSIRAVAQGIGLLYAEYPLAESHAFADFHVLLERPAGIRRWVRPQAVFSFDGFRPFPPLPLAQAYPMLEWALNWCVYSYANQFLIFHAAVIEKEGHAVIMPGEPGVGKSTLCAALVSRGWRLLSDELALVDTDKLRVTPIPRPVSLKNASIDLIRRFAPDAIIGEETYNTAKGTIAHMRPPPDSVERSQELPRPAWLIFPKYEAGEAVQLHDESKGRAFMRIAGSAFNYGLLGLEGFLTVTRLVENCRCYDLTYGDLAGAVEAFETLEPPARSALERARA